MQSTHRPSAAFNLVTGRLGSQRELSPNSLGFIRRTRAGEKAILAPQVPVMAKGGEGHALSSNRHFPHYLNIATLNYVNCRERYNTSET